MTGDDVEAIDAGGQFAGERATLRSPASATSRAARALSS